MIGTDKKPLVMEEMPGLLAEAVSVIDTNPSKQKEEKFLQLAALIYNYNQCGSLPLHAAAPMSESPAEELEYCDTAAVNVLKEILNEGIGSLLEFWLQLCYNKRLIVQSEIVPNLLMVAAHTIALRPLISFCCGKRGEWLGTFNSDWNFVSGESDEDTWQTGTLELRKEVLRRTRTTDITKTREWLQQCWPQEDANTKTALLEVIAVNLNEDDIPFLKSLSAEKSKKVKDAALKLLKQIPGSDVVQLYQKVLSESLSIKKEKVLLGLKNKTVLQYRLPKEVDEKLYSTGIDRISSSKEITDDEYVVLQLMASVPPSFLEQLFGMAPGEVIEVLQKDESARRTLPAVRHAIIRFSDTTWAEQFIIHARDLAVDIVALLSNEQQKDAYCVRFFNQDPEQVIPVASNFAGEWSPDLARNILRFAATNPYKYDRQFFIRNINRVPVNVAVELEQFTPQEEHFKVPWSKMSELIRKLIAIKINSIKAFEK